MKEEGLDLELRFCIYIVPHLHDMHPCLLNEKGERWRESKDPKYKPSPQPHIVIVPFDIKETTVDITTALKHGYFEIARWEFLIYNKTNVNEIYYGYWQDKEATTYHPNRLDNLKIIDFVFNLDLEKKEFHIKSRVEVTRKKQKK